MLIAYSSHGAPAIARAARSRTYLRSVQVACEPRDQLPERLLVAGRELGAAIALPLVPENARQRAARQGGARPSQRIIVRVAFGLCVVRAGLPSSRSVSRRRPRE
jgi:hypothetical protein